MKEEKLDKTFKASGSELLEMIKENKLECGTIIRYDTGDVERFPSGEERKIYEYYRYTAGDKRFHRCDKDGKLGVKGQKRFMNYETIYKEFEVFPAEPKMPYTFCTPDGIIIGAATKEKIEEALNLIYSAGFKF